MKKRLPESSTSQCVGCATGRSVSRHRESPGGTAQEEELASREVVIYCRTDGLDYPCEANRAEQLRICRGWCRDNHARPLAVIEAKSNSAWDCKEFHRAVSLVEERNGRILLLESPSVLDYEESNQKDLSTDLRTAGIDLRFVRMRALPGRCVRILVGQMLDLMDVNTTWKRRTEGPS